MPSSFFKEKKCFWGRDLAPDPLIVISIPSLLSTSPVQSFQGEEKRRDQSLREGKHVSHVQTRCFNATRRAKGMEDRYLIRHFCLFHLKKRHRSLLTLICLVLALIYCSFCNIFGILQATPLLNFTDWGRLKL